MCFFVYMCSEQKADLSLAATLMLQRAWKRFRNKKWSRIMNGIDTNVFETVEKETKEDDATRSLISLLYYTLLSCPLCYLVTYVLLPAILSLTLSPISYPLSLPYFTVLYPLLAYRALYFNFLSLILFSLTLFYLTLSLTRFSLLS